MLAVVSVNLDTMPAFQPHIRPLDRSKESQRALVVSRMRLTLQEVLGQEEGASLYTLEWLRDRLDWHLEGSSCAAEVFLAESTEESSILGHTIVRLEEEEGGTPFGLFSTTYVTPEARRLGVAAALIEKGEDWLRRGGMTRFATDTASDNKNLIRLFERRGYTIALSMGGIVRLLREESLANSDLPPELG